MKTLATLHAKELYDVIRFPADTSGEPIPDPDGRGREPVLTLHTQCGFSFFSFFGSRGFPWGSLFHNCAGTYKDRTRLRTARRWCLPASSKGRQRYASKSIQSKKPSCRQSSHATGL
nr:MAG TPA: hypothetical protein [Caudoviricetes sp.]